MSVLLIFLFSFVNQVHSTGYLKIGIKSSLPQKATVILSDHSELSPHLVLPIILPENRSVNFGDFAVNFEKQYNVSVVVDQTESLGLESSVYHGTLTPLRGTSSPRKLNLPLTGIEFTFGCDVNWSGDKCDVACKNCNLQEKTKLTYIDFHVDYTLNQRKMEEIIGNMRKGNEINNEFVAIEEVEGSGQL